MFYLAYHLHWSPNDVIELDVETRRAYLRLLMEQLEREKEAVEQAKKGR